MFWKIVGWVVFAAFILWCFSSWENQSVQDRMMGTVTGIAILVFYFCNRLLEELKGLRADMATLRRELHNARTARVHDPYDD